MTAEKKAATIDLGPGIQTLVDKQIRDALAVTFNKDRVEAMVEAEVLKRVQDAVQKQVNDARSGWMGQTLRDYISASILDRMSRGDWANRVDAMIAAAWKTYSEGDSARGQKDLKDFTNRQISERIWQLARDTEGMQMVKAAIENLVMDSLQSASESYAGRVVTRYIKENTPK